MATLSSGQLCSVDTLNAIDYQIQQLTEIDKNNPIIAKIIELWEQVPVGTSNGGNGSVIDEIANIKTLQESILNGTYVKEA